jgi:hypothetical protein
MATKKSATNFVKDGKLTASNTEILNTVRYYAPNDYKQRIPIATQGNISQVMKAMNSYQPNWDIFWNVFIGRIGRSVINNRFGFQNPLKFAKKSALEYGMSVQEAQVNLIKAREYDPYGANVFGREGREPDIHVAYHVQNRQNKYEINIPMEDVLRGAFAEGASISALFNACLAAPTDSNENDEMLLMLKLFDLANKQDGIYNVNIPTVSVTDSHADNLEKATRFARAARAMLTNLKVYSTDYSAEGREKGLATRAAEPIMIVSGTMDACMNVDMYQYAFNAENGQIPVDRLVVIPDNLFPIKGASAFLLDKDVLQCYDTLSPVTLSSGMNPDNMSYNYFLHVWQILSLSRFLPLVMFSDQPDTGAIDATPATYTGVTLTYDGKSEGIVFDAGNSYQLNCTVEGTNSPNQAVRYGIKLFTGAGNGKALPADMFIDSSGVFHVGNQVSAGDIIKLYAVSLENETLEGTVIGTVGTATAAVTEVSWGMNTLPMLTGNLVTLPLTITPADGVVADVAVGADTPAMFDTLGVMTNSDGTYSAVIKGRGTGTANVTASVTTVGGGVVSATLKIMLENAEG